MVSRTRSEGPGLRFAIWLQGCSIRCPGCCNPHMQAMDAGDKMHIRVLAGQVKTSGLTEVSILGGEPLDQIHPLLNFITLLKNKNCGIMVFTGYTMKQIRNDAELSPILDQIDLIKTGPFLKDRQSVEKRWIGSDNQAFHHLTDRYKGHPELDDCCLQSVSISFAGDKAIISGRPFFKDIGKGAVQ